MSVPIDATEVCNCNDEERAACQEPFSDFKGKRYCLFHLPSEDKDRDGAFGRAVQKRLETGNYFFRGVWFPVDFLCNHTFGKDADFSNAVFNAKTNFSNTSFNEKAHFLRTEFRSDTAFINTTFKDADFSNVFFNGLANLRDASFEEKVRFVGARFKKKATFTEAQFKEADFSWAEFEAQSIFENAEFDGANFEHAIFGKDGGTNFSSAAFKTRVTFRNAQFRFGVMFSQATITGSATFDRTSFDDYVLFEGTEENQVFSNESKLYFDAKIMKPEQVSFRFLMLKPHWFIFVDPRKFDFARVNWQSKITEEVKAVKKLKPHERSDSREIDFPHDRLATVCQRLAANYEENNVFDKASKFRHMAMAVKERETAHGWAFWKLSWWYGLASGYGERTWQAAIVLITIWAVFAVIFFFGQGNNWWKNSQIPGEGTIITTETLGPETRTLTVAITSGVKTSPLLSFRDALIYSAGVMTLQKPEPQPVNKIAKSLVLLEMILGPVQGALLALAIRRKFMS